MPNKDYYKTLHVAANAHEDVLKAAFRALVKIHQGDEPRMKEINEAWEVLGDKDNKKKYDKDRDAPRGKVIGDYKVISKIAEGGFGVTYRAEHTTLGTSVCIKHALNISPEDEQLLLEEARSMWDLRHFGIPAMRDLLRMPDGSLSLVMSYVPGKDLAKVIEDDYPKGLEPEHVAWICERTLNILKYLHMHGVVHGDVKPQNIIIQPDSHTVVVVDYGLSMVRPRASDGSKGYTPYFASPEAIDGSPLIPESDLYGLAMTMVFALGGNIDAVRVPDTIPEEMLKFMKNMLRRDPLQRPRVWEKEDLTESVKTMRNKAFGRIASNMKPLKIS